MVNAQQGEMSERSLDEQSSIDYSNLMEASTHTSSLLVVDNVESNRQHRRRTSSNALESLLEETPSEVQAVLLETPTPQQENEHDGSRFLKTSIDLEHGDTTHAKAGFATTISHMPSATLHASNANPELYKKMQDESDDLAAWTIHIVLSVFIGLIIVSALLTFFLIHTYGVVALGALLLIISFSVFLVWFVDKTVLTKNPKFAPVRNKFLRAAEVARNAVSNEMQLFQRDWNEYALLTDGETGSTEEETFEEDGVTSPQPGKKVRRSVLFSLVKPVLRVRRKMFRRRRKQPKQASATYEPPTTTSGVAV